jgi:hypothetical protein
MSSDKQPMYVYNKVRARIRFGQYLYGFFFGFILGVLNTFIEIRSKEHLSLWIIAIKHELQNMPLNLDTLQRIKRTY